MRISFIPLFLILALLTAGCTNLNIFGGDVVSIITNTNVEGFQDVLIIKDIRTIPRSIIPPDQDTFLSFVLENKDDKKSAKNVKIQLFDAPGFKSSSTLCNVHECKPEECSTDAPCANILPGEEKLISFNLKSPTQQEIGNVKNEITFSFKTNYEFDANTLYRIPVVNMNEILSRQRADQNVEIDSPKFISSGPIQADIELKGQDFVIAGNEATLQVQFSNKGDKRKGSVVGNIIEDEDITITFPEDLTVTDWPKKVSDAVNNNGVPSNPLVDDNSQSSTEKNAFSCSGNTCTNSGSVELFEGESIPLLFKIKSSAINDPFKTYDISIAFSYQYELRDSIKVTVQPNEE